MLKAHEFTDGETLRRQRNLTQNQKKNNVNTQEGVLINNYYKPDFTEISDTLIISDNVELLLFFKVTTGCISSPQEYTVLSFATYKSKEFVPVTVILKVLVKGLNNLDSEDTGV